MKENFTNAQSDPLYEAATKILTGQIDEASNFVSKGIYTLDGKKVMGSRSSKLFLMAKDSDDNLHDLSWKEWSQLNVTDTSSDAIKKEFINRLVKQIKMFNKKVDLNTWIKSKNPSFEDTVNYIFKLDPNIKYSKTGGLKEDFSEETINENKKVTSEKSQFGGFRPKIVNGDGSVFFLGSQAFKTSQGAEKAAQYYLDQYEKGVNTKNIKMMKGDYVKESELQEVTKGKLVDILKKEGWKSMDMADLDDAIRKAKVNTPLGDVIGAWSKADKIVLFYDDGTSDFVSLRDKKITSTKDLWFGNPSKLREASDDLGTVTIVAPGHKYHGKTARVFHKFDDGRINVQYKKSDKKGDLINLTLKKGQYKLDEETIQEQMLGFSHPEVSRQMLDIIDEFDARDVEALLKHMIDSFTYPDNEDSDIDLLVKNLKRTLHDWKNRSSN